MSTKARARALPVKLRVHTLTADCKLPPGCPEDVVFAPAGEPTPDEAAALVLAGVWPTASPGHPYWFRALDDGSAWAGGALDKGALLAHVRGKHGHRVTGKGPGGRLCITHSFSMKPAHLDALTRLAEEARRQLGRNVATSAVLGAVIEASGVDAAAVAAYVERKARRA